MSTDSEWEEWGRKDPYYGVITCRQFRRAELTKAAKEEFFESGRVHVDYLLQIIRQYIDHTFEPQSVLDLGCGVGRLIVPFAKIAKEVVGLDVSSSMLAEARKNCHEFGVRNAQLLLSDDNISALRSKTYDLIHSFIVFQHIPPERGRDIFRNLLDHLSAGGIAAVHFTYSKTQYASTHGVAPPVSRLSSGATSTRDAVSAPDTDPEMQMNPYPLNELFFLMQNAGVHRFHVEFTDHGGELGIFLYFQKPRV
jgi:2-polyprenyl-3-methyl-5-hydroxy-6-metoxy-1,4-benzoquinol methylase